MRVLFRDSVKSYAVVLLLAILAGALVGLFLEFPRDNLWNFYDWSAKNFGFWMFSTSLLVLTSEKRKTAAFNSALYIFVMFLLTTVHQTLRLYEAGNAPFSSLSAFVSAHLSGWLLYSVPSALLCGVCGAVLWSGRKNHRFGKLLRTLPAVFLFLETLLRFFRVFTAHTELFSAVTDLLCLFAYCKILKKAKDSTKRGFP